MSPRPPGAGPVADGAPVLGSVARMAELSVVHGPLVVHDRAAFARARQAMQGRVAVVMTMGALHEGHASLVRAARKVADRVVVTVFVNPLQFGAGEDLDRYPRTLEADLAVCEREGADVVFAPTPDVVYPTAPLVRVSAGQVAVMGEETVHSMWCEPTESGLSLHAYGNSHFDVVERRQWDPHTLREEPFEVGRQRAWVRELTTKVGLSERLSHRPSELSGGQQQRVAIARALVTRPTVMFADEPTGNLDSTTSGEILELLRDSVTSLGQTTVMVTHDAHAAEIADRVLFLADGLIVKDIGESSAHEIIGAMEEVTAR